MAYQNRHSVSGSVPDIIDISDLEDMDAVEVEVPQQSTANRRLTQALNYIQSEGGNDSPVTFINRVNRIDRELLRRPGHNADGDLYHQVQTMVRKVQRDFEDASAEPASDPESSDAIPSGFVPIEVLYRGESSSPTPAPLPRAPSSPTSGPKRRENIQRTRVFKYGGPENDPEHWHSNAPPSLPFPETFLMAHWESLKTDYDLSRPKDAKHTETNVPFDHPALEPYLNLPQYESGSRFKLPDVRAEVQNAIARYGTSERLAGTVEEVSGLDASGDNEKDYAPSVFLEKWRVGEQRFPAIVEMGKLREKMAWTPSRGRSGKGVEMATAPAIKLPTTTPRVTKVPVPQRKTPQTKPKTASPAFRRISHEVRAAEKADARDANKTTSPPSTASKSKPATKAAPSGASKPTKAPEPRTTCAGAVPPTSKPVPKPTKITTSPPKPTFTLQPPCTATYVAIPKRPRGRPRKDAVPATPVESAPTSLGKRKLSIGSQPHREPTPASSRAGKKQKVGVVEKEVVKKTVEKKQVKGRKLVEKKESKATKAGKLAKKGRQCEKKEVKEVKFTESVAGGRGTTRSGKGYTI